MTGRPIDLASIQRLGIDTAPLIYFVERHPLFSSVVRAFFERAERGELSLVTSTLTLAEVLTKPFAQGAEAIATTYRSILTTSPHIRLVPIDIATAEHAARLRAKYRLKTPDAIQVAVAARSGCDAFLTNDGGLSRVEEIPVLVLSDLLA